MHTPIIADSLDTKVFIPSEGSCLLAYSMYSEDAAPLSTAAPMPASTLARHSTAKFVDQNSINMNPATRHNTPMISVRSRDHRSNSTDVGSSLADSLTSNTTLTMEISSTDRPTS